MAARHGTNIRLNDADRRRIGLLRRWMGESPAAPERGVTVAATVRYALAHTVQDLHLQARYAIEDAGGNPDARAE